MDIGFETLWLSTGIANFTLGQAFMMFIGALLIYLAIVKKFEPLLLLPIGFGAVLSNIPVAGLAENAVGQLFIEGKPEHLALLANSIGVSIQDVVTAWKHADISVLLN